MNYNKFDSFAFLSSKDTIHYLNRDLNFSNDIILRLLSHEVDGRFLREQFAQGHLRKTLCNHPFNFPLGISAKIETWVENSIREGEEYEISDPNSTGSQSTNIAHHANPFVESMELQYQTKTMLASTLLSQRNDVQLEKLVARLMLALGEQNAWLKFANAKGATCSEKAVKYISEAQATGKPEHIVIPAIAQFPNYLAINFLNDLKTLIDMKHVTSEVENIEKHLTYVENTTQQKGNKVAQINMVIRKWIVDNELCDVTSQDEIQNRVDALKNYEVTSLDELKLLEPTDFEKCGFKGIKAKKAFTAAQKK